MSYDERINIYTRIEAYRRRPLLVYVTSGRGNASARIAADVITEFAKQILAIPQEDEEVDLLVVSNGGDPTVSWRIISMLRERFKKVYALLPYIAYSAATLLALGADEIVMHPFSNLGPVDPQISNNKQGNNDRIEFSSEDIRNYIDFVREDVGISDQAQLSQAFSQICQELGAIPIGIAKRSSQLMLSMGEKLLSLHMNDTNKARTISETLSRSFYHHGYALGRAEAKKIELPVCIPEKELEDLMWAVWEDMAEEMEWNNPFDPMEIALKDEETYNRLTKDIPQVEIPQGLPPQVIQQIIQQIMTKIQATNSRLVDYEIFQAALESSRYASQYRAKGKLIAVRQPNMEVQITLMPVSKGWK